MKLIDKVASYVRNLSDGGKVVNDVRKACLPVVGALAISGCDIDINTGGNSGNTTDLPGGTVADTADDTGDDTSTGTTGEGVDETATEGLEECPPPSSIEGFLSQKVYDLGILTSTPACLDTSTVIPTNSTISKGVEEIATSELGGHPMYQIENNLVENRWVPAAGIHWNDTAVLIDPFNFEEWVSSSLESHPDSGLASVDLEVGGEFVYAAYFEDGVEGACDPGSPENLVEKIYP